MLKASRFFPLCITIVLACTAIQCVAQQYVLKNEHLVFSFYTQQHKRLVIAMDNGEQYLVYRFGTDKKIELEYPARDTASWKKMQFFTYMRPGGKENAGLDLNNISFICGDRRYVVYENSSAESSSDEIGVMVMDLKGNKLADFAAKPGTQKGSLIDLRTYTELLAQGREEY